MVSLILLRGDISMCLIDFAYFFLVATKKQFDDTVAIHPTSAEGKLMLFPLLALALTLS